jgi:gamma-glutamyltranspeptidase/glutathione hydrolase
MSPTVVVEHGRPVLVVGGSGGPFIISAATQVLLDRIVFDTALADAVAAPRIHDQGAPMPVLVEPGVSPVVRTRLDGPNRAVREFGALGAASAVGLTRQAAPIAGADPRKHGGITIVR